MRTVSINFLSVVLALSVCGCFSSREQGDEVDSGVDGADDTIKTGGTGGGDTSKTGSGGIDSGHAAVGGKGVRPFDAAIIDAVVVQAGIGGIEDIRRAGGTGDINIDDDAGMDDAPCAPNCPSLEWVTIPGGTFMMGSAEGIGNDDERPQHEVTVQTFRMSKTEVTVEQYRVCVDVDICSTPIHDNEPDNWGKSGRENHPVNSVDWHQAREFAEWIGARLPSEAEWEFAARRGGRDISYPWGNEDVTCERAVFATDESGIGCGNATMEVCSKPLGNTVQGLCDMAGNVSEWVEDDWHSSYSGAPSNGQAWIGNLNGDFRVLRGGSWYVTPDGCRSAYRLRSNPDNRHDYIGFRIVLDLD